MRALLVLLLLFVAGAARAETLAGTVIVVIDGDTVLFKPDRYRASSRAFLKVRLADIDAPETGQPHGEAATRALKDIALERRATLEIVATDAYGRKVGRLQVDALPVNAELVRRGWAWAYEPARASARSGSESFRASTRYRRNPALVDAQHEARRARLGLWRDAEPTPPWVWRRTHARAY